MTFDEMAKRMKGNLFLSSMMGRCDGGFCAARAADCSMVQLGSFVLLAEREERTAYWPDPDRVSVGAFLRNEIDTCRRESASLVGEENVPLVCASIFPCADEDTAMSAEVFVEAGGDLYELNSHGGIGGDRERGTGAMLFMPEHTAKLMRWAKMLVDAGGPVIIKAMGGVIPDLSDHVRGLEDIGVHAFHINVRDEESGKQDIGLLEAIRAATGMFLLASGYVRNAATARALFDAGADCVGIAQAALSDPGIFTRCRA
jgi:tRNA-dihydrouridine synthase